MIKVEELEALIPPDAFAGLGLGEINQVLEDIGAAARSEWVRLASKDRSSFRYDYINGIQEVQSPRPGRVVISLVGEIPHLLEDGAPMMDMRDILLGPHVPESPLGERGKHRSVNDGFYRAIPFRHMTPGSGDAPRGNTHGQEMGKPYSGAMAEGDAAKLGQEVYAKAKQLSPTRSAPGAGAVYGGRLAPGTGGAYPLANKVTGTKHKTDIYAGMIREEKTYEKAVQHQYATFRTISTGVNDGSWIRKPIPARHYAEKVAAYAARLAPRVIEKLMEAKK